MIAPDSFELSDIDGSSSPVNDVVPDDQEDAVREAAHSCPNKQSSSRNRQSQPDLREDENLERR